MVNRTTTVLCPNCQAENDFDPVTLIHEGSEDLARLIDGSLNTTRCTICNTQYLFETPILYRDGANRYLVYFIPRSITDKLNEALEQMDELYKRIFDDFDEDERPVCRLATRRSSFIEKIALSREGFDDRIIEYVKYQLYQNSEGLDAIRHELLYNFGNSSDTEISFLAFDRDTGRAVYSLAFPRVDYDQLNTYFLATEKMRDELKRMFHTYHVQVDELLESGYFIG